MVRVACGLCARCLCWCAFRAQVRRRVRLASTGDVKAVQHGEVLMVVHVVIMGQEPAIILGVQIIRRVRLVVNVGVNVLCLIDV